MNRSPPLVGGPEETVERISDHFELLAVMGRNFAATLDIEATLKRGLELITRHLDAAGGALFLLDESGAVLRCEACYGATEITGVTLGIEEGVVGRCVRNNAGEIVRDVADDLNFQGSVDERSGFTTRSILCAPLSVKDQRIGAIELVNKLSGDGLFAGSDLELLEALSSSAALAILNARMAEALVEQERVRRELELAAEIQRSLLPEPRPPPFQVHGVNVPARTVSGDFYDFFPLDDGRICFNLGDVSGKGMNAALLMAKTASLFRCLGKTIHQPGRLLGRINVEICETTARGMFVTMVGGVYDPATGSVRLANAGHEPPLFHTADDTFEAFEAEAPPLGVSPLLSASGDFPETELRLDGGTLYVFTDGVTEGYLEDGGELRVDGFKELIRANARLTATARIDAVIGRIDRGDGALHDDLTVLAIEDGLQAKQGETRRAVNASTKTKAAPGNLLKLSFPSQPRHLKQVRKAVSEAARKCGCDETSAHDIVIAVDEACQNVIRHAYGGASRGEIVVEVDKEGDRFVVHVQDFAPAIDLDKIKPRDLDDLRPGGLGTHFIQEVMDEVEFLPLPLHGGNRLRMAKRITKEPNDEP